MKRNAVVLAVLVLLVSACGEAGSDGSTFTTTGASPEPRGVRTAGTSLGTILVDPSGMTMYVFTLDTEGESVCYDSCAILWPPVPGNVSIGPGLDPSMFGVTIRTDGTTQLTVGGQPLYLWASDNAPGDVTGQNVDGVWFVVDSSGRIAGASAVPQEPDYDGY